jgi:hypothetical protein
VKLRNNQFASWTAPFAGQPTGYRTDRWDTGSDRRDLWTDGWDGGLNAVMADRLRVRLGQLLASMDDATVVPSASMVLARHGSRPVQRRTGRFRWSDVERMESQILQLRTEMQDGFSAIRTDLRAELHGVETGLRTELHDVRDALRSEIGEVRDTLRSEIHEVRDTLKSEIADDQLLEGKRGASG